MRKVKEVVDEVYNRLENPKPSYKVLERYIYELLEKKKIDFVIHNNRYLLPDWAGNVIVLWWKDREERKRMRKLRASFVKKFAEEYGVSIRRAQQIFNEVTPLFERVSLFGDKQKRKRRSK